MYVQGCKRKMYKTHIYANFYGFVKFLGGMWWGWGIWLWQGLRSKMEGDLGQAGVFLDSKESDHQLKHYPFRAMSISFFIPELSKMSSCEASGSNTTLYPNCLGWLKFCICNEISMVTISRSQNIIGLVITGRVVPIFFHFLWSVSQVILMKTTFKSFLGII